MRKYGYNMATEFTRKQVNVIYALNKQNKLDVPEEAIKTFYELADFYGCDFNMRVTKIEQIVMNMLEAIFADDLEEAQHQVDLYKALYLETPEEDVEEDVEEEVKMSDMKEAEKSLYDALDMDITDDIIKRDYRCNRLTSHNVNGREFLCYRHDNKEAAIHILTKEVITDADTISDICRYY